MHIVAVIPAYNEGGRVGTVLRGLAPFVGSIVVVDDASTDTTAQEARSCGAYVLRHVVNRGQGAALQTGTTYALDVLGADVVIHFDADGQMNAAEIPLLVEALIRDEVNIVLGTRRHSKTTGMPFSRKLTLWLGKWFTFFLSGIRVSDTHNGFRVLSRQAALSINITLDRMAHASQILDQIQVLGLRFKEVPVTIAYTRETLQKGQSSLGALRIVQDILKGKFFDI